jgi:hypothetical protein
MVFIEKEDKTEQTNKFILKRRDIVTFDDADYLFL